MDLPTYTNIWRIEKRLYKLYDFRLPMPLPLGQIAVFTAIVVPYVVILAVLGVPFSHTLLWLYVLPPGVLTWCATRPVLESKRLPELVVSQLRYLGEPRTWCRMAPLAEPGDVMVTARVWRRHRPVELAELDDPFDWQDSDQDGRGRGAAIARPALAPVRPAISPAPRPVPDSPERVAAATGAATTPRPGGGPVPAGLGDRPRHRRRARPRPPTPAQPVPGQPVTARGQSAPGPGQSAPGQSAPKPGQSGHGSAPGTPRPQPGSEPPRFAQPWSAQPWSSRAQSARAAGSQQSRTEGRHPAGAPDQPGGRGPQAPAASGRPDKGGWPHVPPSPAAQAPHEQAPSRPPGSSPRHVPAAMMQPVPGAPPSPGVPDEPERQDPAKQAAADTQPPSPRDAPAGPPSRPVVTVTEHRSAERPARMVERALGSPAERRAEGWRDRVVVVPGGHRPSQPDQLQRDRARARLAIAGSRRIVVLGCTVGAGQTVTTLRTGEQLASLRDEPVAVLDLNPGASSLLRMARQDPVLTGEAHPSGPGQPSRLEVIATEPDETGSDQDPDEPGAADSARIFELMSARYSLTLADPGASAVPRVLPVADQLILVAPASAEAAGAIAMTLEWLDAHGHAGLAGGAITVLNGVSKQTMSFVEQAEAVAGGRCRAIVRVPWDEQLKNHAAERQLGAHPAGPGARPGGQPSAPAERAYTALAGALVAGLVTAPQLRRGRS